jgi:GT2 family glycosyltransferase/SAM-dependent methyltransferase
MDEIRSPSAPRLIEWTGERMVPWAPDVQVIYEHLHRYWFTAALAAGQRVLDVGSGEGYGTAILASVADSACGIELDETSVAHSRANYQADNLEFRVGSALDLSDFADSAFGLVVCFEVLEHIAEQEQLLDGIARVLGPDGILLCSTPERVSYSELTGQENPFHVRELTEREFRDLLGARFPTVRLWAQRTSTGSAIYPIDAGGSRGEAVFIERDGDGWRRSDAPDPMYMIAAASSGAAADLPDLSTLVDPSRALLRSTENRLSDVYEELGELHRRAGARIASLEAQEREFNELLAARQAELTAARATLADTAAARERLEGAEAMVRRLEASVTWKVLERVHRRVVGAGDSRTAVGRAASVAMGALGRRLDRRSKTRAQRALAERLQPPTHDKPLLRLPEYEQIKASIVIPVHNQAAATLACLRALFMNSDGVGYEVIVVDDASGAEVVDLLGRVRGVRVLRNDANQGFLRSVNRGIAAARGKHVVLLNNDTEVQGGWLKALVELVESADDVGAVAAKLLLPDGPIQEAGGIVWRDGSAMHAGRGEHRFEASFNYVRPVDYGSAACLLVRGDVLRDLGGFDERYAPAYYEDVDLCFAVRERGLRVLYQPRAEVVHHEGTSHGIDVTTGVKANQMRNAAIFHEKWREVLDRDQAAPDPEHALRHADRTGGPRVLVADYRVPAAREDAGSLRMREMLLALRKLGCHVTFMPENKVAAEPDTTELQQAGIEVLHGPFDERDVISQIGSDLRMAILSRPTVASRLLALLRELVPAAHVVYDTVDLHYLREQRRAQAQDGVELDELIRTYRDMESWLVGSCDETLTVSDDERRAVLGLVPDATVSVIPTINRIDGEPAPAGGREGLMFLGGFHHPPNVDCAIHLVRDVVPLVRRALGSVRVAIVGSHPPPEVLALSEVDDVEVTGFVEDLTPYFQRYRLMAAPLRFGAGVNGKITHSLASGLPVVTTAIGAEGLAGVNGQHLLVADDVESFAAAVAKLYGDDGLWERLSANGRALAAERFGPGVAVEALERMLAGIAATPSRNASSSSMRRSHA